MFMIEGFKPISITSGVPTLSITKNGIGFNKAAILKIDAPQYVRVLQNSEKNMIALCPCNKDDDYAAPFAKDGLKTINVRWNSKDFTSTIALMVSWDGTTRGKKVVGQYYAEENMLIFDMNQAVEMDGQEDD